jgi:hypothetical protein
MVFAGLRTNSQWHFTKPGLRARIDILGGRVLGGGFGTAGKQGDQRGG